MLFLHAICFISYSSSDQVSTSAIMRIIFIGAKKSIASYRGIAAMGELWFCQATSAKKEGETWLAQGRVIALRLLAEVPLRLNSETPKLTRVPEEEKPDSRGRSSPQVLVSNMTSTMFRDA